MFRRTFIHSLLALVGCRSRKTSSGDFAQFFVSEVRARGGRVLEVERLPIIEGQWRVERDKYGFQIHLVGVEFAPVDSFMTLVLGEPEISVPANTDGYRQRMYDGKVSNMHIQLVEEKSEIYVVAVGPKKN
jgi:hypothetical protein